MMAFSGWGLRWRGLFDNEQGEWWLLSQVSIIAAHLLPSWPSPMNLGFAWPKVAENIGLSLFLFGVILSMRAFLHLGSSLSPLPDPKAGATLKTLGAYSKCRHPLYQSLLISSLGISIWLGSLFHLSLLICLCFVLKGKARREERRLKELHPEYTQYLANTPAFFAGMPFLDWRV